MIFSLDLFSVDRRPLRLAEFGNYKLSPAFDEGTQSGCISTHAVCPAHQTAAPLTAMHYWQRGFAA
jgi:hypothetical protein